MNDFAQRERGPTEVRLTPTGGGGESSTRQQKIPQLSDMR
jgi:hypothetical protein